MAIRDRCHTIGERSTKVTDIKKKCIFLYKIIAIYVIH